MKTEDEDGVGGPFEKAMRAMPRKATSKKKAFEKGVGISAETLRQLIDSDVRPDNATSRLNPILPVGKVKEIFRASLAATEAKRPFDPKYVEARTGRAGMTPNMDLLTAANILREFGLPEVSP